MSRPYLDDEGPRMWYRSRRQRQREVVAALDRFHAAYGCHCPVCSHMAAECVCEKAVKENDAPANPVEAIAQS